MSLLGEWCERSYNLKYPGTEAQLRAALKEADERIARLEEAIRPDAVSPTREALERRYR